MPRDPADPQAPAGAERGSGATPASALPELPVLAGLLPDRWRDAEPVSAPAGAAAAASGATVAATAPVANTAAAAVTVAVPSSKPTTTADAGAADVLLVDDSDIALRYLQRRLAEFGLRCDLARDSTAALERLAHTHYRLVLIDVQLGEASPLDGLALCRDIKRRSGATPVVALVSAHAGATDRVRGSLAGCDAYLQKPLLASELAALAARLQRRPAGVAAADRVRRQ